MLAYLGHHAKVITPDVGQAVHIIMDRNTGKTHEAYVEFFSRADAEFWMKAMAGRHIGTDRPVAKYACTQSELLSVIFPRAKCIDWRGGYDNKQIVALPTADPFNTGFKAFLTQEDLQVLVRHAQQPHRVRLLNEADYPLPIHVQVQLTVSCF